MGSQIPKPSPAGWDVPIILQSRLRRAPSQTPWAVMESNLPRLLRTRGWGDELGSHRKGRNSVRALSRHCPASLSPTPAPPRRTPGLSTPVTVLAPPKFPLPRPSQSTCRATSPSKSRWLCQHGSGAALDLGSARGTRDAPGGHRAQPRALSGPVLAATGQEHL